MLGCPSPYTSQLSCWFTFLSPGSSQSCRASSSRQVSSFSCTDSSARRVCLSMAEGTRSFCRQPKSPNLEVVRDRCRFHLVPPSSPPLTASTSSQMTCGDLRPATDRNRGNRHPQPPSPVPYSMSLTAVLLLRSNVN